MSVKGKMTALADSIRSKSGISGALSLDAMKNAVDAIQTGAGEAQSADGFAVKARDAIGNPTAVTVYGSKIKPYTCGANVARTYKWFGSTVTVFEFADRISELMPQAFYNALGSDTDISFPSATNIGNQAFYGSAFKSVSLPDSAVLGNEIFRLSSITSITVPASRVETNVSATFRQWTGTTAVCGSIGHPWIAYDTTFLGASNASSVTLFCKGANVDANLRSIRNGASNASIIIKASENTSYGGVNYAAGDTMITSTVEV